MQSNLIHSAQNALEQLDFLNSCLPHKTGTDAADALRKDLAALQAQPADESPCACWPGRMCSRSAQCARDAQTAAAGVSDEELRQAVDALRDPNTVSAFYNGYYTLTPGELRRAILALRPQAVPMTDEQKAAPKLIGWRTENFLWETDDVDKARNWEPNIGVLPIFEGDPNTKLGSRGITAQGAQGGEVGHG